MTLQRSAILRIVRLLALFTSCACGRIRFDDVVDASPDSLGPAHRFLYYAATYAGAKGVYGFELDSSGLPGALGLTPIAATSVQSIAIEPRGRFAYVVTIGPDTVSTYAIDPATGSLTQTDVATGNGLAGPTALAIDRTGTYVTVANDRGTSLSTFAIDPASGALAPAGVTLTGSTDAYVVEDLRFAPDGDILYMARANDAGGVAGFSLALDTGELLPIAGSPWSLAPNVVGPDPFQLAFHPSGRWLFGSDEGNGRVLWADRDATTGQLTPHLIELGLGGGLLFGLAFDATGSRLYVCDCSGANRVYVVAVDLVTGSQTSIGQGPSTSCPEAVLVDSDRSLLYVLDAGVGLLTYPIDSGGLIGAAISSLPAAGGIRFFATADTHERW